MLKFIDRAVVAYYNKRTREHLPIITGDDLAAKADEFAEDTLKKISGRYGGNAHFQTRESAKTFFKKQFYDAARGGYGYNVIDPLSKKHFVADPKISEAFSLAVKAGGTRPTLKAEVLDHQVAAFAYEAAQSNPVERRSYFYFENHDSYETAKKDLFYDLMRKHYDVTEVVEENPLRSPSPN